MFAALPLPPPPLPSWVPPCTQQHMQAVCMCMLSEVSVMLGPYMFSCHEQLNV